MKKTAKKKATKPSTAASGKKLTKRPVAQVAKPAKATAATRPKSSVTDSRATSAGGTLSSRDKAITPAKAVHGGNGSRGRDKPVHRDSATTDAQRTSRNSKDGERLKPTSPPSPPRPPRPIEKEPPPVKTHLTDKQLEEFRDLLLQKRAQLTGDVQGLATEARGRSAQGESEHSNMPIHMADLGSDTWEQDFTFGLIANAESVVREIDDALRRIKDRTYGVCMAGNDKIGVARLRAKPWAKYCVEHARLIEEGRM